MDLRRNIIGFSVGLLAVVALIFIGHEFIANLEYGFYTFKADLKTYIQPEFSGIKQVQLHSWLIASFIIITSTLFSQLNNKLRGLSYIMTIASVLVLDIAVFLLFGFNTYIFTTILGLSVAYLLSSLLLSADLVQNNEVLKDANEARAESLPVNIEQNQLESEALKRKINDLEDSKTKLTKQINELKQSQIKTKKINLQESYTATEKLSTKIYQDFQDHTVKSLISLYKDLKTGNKLDSDLSQRFNLLLANFDNSLFNLVPFKFEKEAGFIDILKIYVSKANFKYAQHLEIEFDQGEHGYLNFHEDCKVNLYRSISDFVQELYQVNLENNSKVKLNLNLAKDIHQTLHLNFDYNGPALDPQRNKENLTEMLERLESVNLRYTFTKSHDLNHLKLEIPKAKYFESATELKEGKVKSSSVNKTKIATIKAVKDKPKNVPQDYSLNKPISYINDNTVGGVNPFKEITVSTDEEPAALISQLPYEKTNNSSSSSIKVGETTGDVIRKTKKSITAPAATDNHTSDINGASAQSNPELAASTPKLKSVERKANQMPVAVESAKARAAATNEEEALDSIFREDLLADMGIITPKNEKKALREENKKLASNLEQDHHLNLPNVVKLKNLDPARNNEELVTAPLNDEEYDINKSSFLKNYIN